MVSPEPTPAVILREAQPEDEPFLYSLFVATHRDEFAPLGLPESHLESLLRMQFDAQRTGYAQSFPGAERSIVLLPDGAAVGQMQMHVSPSNLHLVDLALLPAVQGRGIGETLLRGLLHRADALAIPVRLEVRPGNRAFRLYSRLGFQTVSGGAQLSMEYRPSGLPDQPVPAEASHGPAAGWQARVGSLFRVPLPESDGALELRLTRLDRNPATGDRNFSLTFHGPLQPVLGQGLWELHPQHAQAAPETIFLVPMGPRNTVCEYEAVFNL